jgi:hypothetical protein
MLEGSGWWEAIALQLLMGGCAIAATGVLIVAKCQ